MLFVVRFFLFLLCLGQCLAQSQDAASTPEPAEISVAAPKSSHTNTSSLDWNHLSLQKQQSLMPLQQVWPQLSEAHQRKWITLARKFPKMTPDEQAKLHSRMVDWAALKPKERQLARLNFAETKKLTPTDRLANWEAYKALSPDERKKLTAQALAKNGKSGALTNRPIANQKLISIPPRRFSPESLSALIKLHKPVNKNTLLPIYQAQSPE